MAKVKWRCPHCRQKISASPEHMGKMIHCPRCLEEIEVPADAPMFEDSSGSVSGHTLAPEPPAEESPATHEDTSSAQSAAHAAPPATAADNRKTRPCPQCGQAVRLGGAICIHCGWNLKTNKPARESYGHSADEEKEGAAPAGSKAKMMVMVAAIAVVVIGMVIWALGG